MLIISHTDRKSYKGRLLILCIYLALLLGGATMVYPFLIMLTGAMGTPFDYERRAAWPRFLVSREDRFMRALVGFFPPSHRNSLRQMRAYFPEAPTDWQTWPQIGDDKKASDVFARAQLGKINEIQNREQIKAQADDYAAWFKNQNLRETVLAYDARHIAPFLRGRYGSLEAYNKAWEVSIDDFSKAAAPEWSGEPIDQQTYVPFDDTRYQDLLKFRKAYQNNEWTPFLEGVPANYLRPASLRYLWEDYASEKAPQAAKSFPASGPVWQQFLLEKFPLRHIQIAVTTTNQNAFEKFLQTRFRSVDYMNRVLQTKAVSWRAVRLTKTLPSDELGKAWMDFVRTQIPTTTWRIRETLPDLSWQHWMFRKYGSIEKLNAVYGTSYRRYAEVPIPYGAALLKTFAQRENAFSWNNTTANFRAVGDFLFFRGQAVSNTIILVILALLVTLTVNPLAGYALSRFRLRASEKIIVFCLATMAFPAAVSANPGFLLLRDLGLLNTFAALVLPGAANGMTIFLLKGFFDSLPQELYEAAAIDGAPEWMVFFNISIPLVKPILAVSLLNAFIAYYNGWEWAIIVCQDPSLWTLSVWTYQFYQTMGSNPAMVMAAFIINSIPVLIVFLLCQKIILRGIILPSLK
jgi:multiple sugar transport system permease protein